MPAAAQEAEAEKRELVQFVIAKATWHDGVLAAKPRPPFDPLAEQAAKVRAAESSNALAEPEGQVRSI